MHLSAKGSPRDALSICAPPGVGIAKGPLQQKNLEKNLDIWAEVYRFRAFWTKILLEKGEKEDRAQVKVKWPCATEFWCRTSRIWKFYIRIQPSGHYKHIFVKVRG